MRPEDLDRFATVTDPRIHPDGTRVAFVVSRMDFDADRYHRTIWVWDGSSARALVDTGGDFSPRWSPDGTKLAFLRKAEGDEAQPQLAVFDLVAESTEVLTDLPLGVSEVQWSPRGDRIAFVATDWREAGLSDEERARRPKRITRLPYRFDNEGWKHDRTRSVYVIDGDGGHPVCLTPGDYDDTAVAWRPDGGALAFLSARHPRRGIEPGVQAWEVPATGGDPSPLTAPAMWEGVGYSPPGVPHVWGLADPSDYPDLFRVYRIEPERTLTDLTGHTDRSVFGLTITPAPNDLQWVSDTEFLVLVEDAGTEGIVRVNGNGTVESVVGGDRVVTGFSARTDGSALVFCASEPTDPGELWWYEDCAARRLTAVNAEFRERVPLVEPQPFVTEDGTVSGWVYLPPGDDPAPVLLNIHGGPATQYQLGFFDEFQVCAAAGYGVVAANPRGSSGYGLDHVRAVIGAWAKDEWPDEADVTAALARALDLHPRLDEDRVGVMGGSYGGFLTMRLLTRSDRFASAVAERGLYSWPSFGGTSDIGPWFGALYFHRRAGHDELWRGSPLSAAAAITTPTLIIHSEEDWRCPIEQAEQLFTILVANDVDTEMVRFPGEGHELSRSGTPRHRRERFDAILDWHGRHLAFT